MGEDQWFQPTVRNRLSQAIVLAKFTILYGKFYDISESISLNFSHSVDEYLSSLDNRFQETASAQGTKIPGGNQYEWGHSGRQNSPSGTEGIFEVHLDGSGEKIAEIYWVCPYIGSNKIEKRYIKEGYDVSIDGFSIPSGALGNGRINVRED
jgi:hypothetical protein